LSSLAASAALATVSCGAQPSDLQASVRAAARQDGERVAAIAARPAAHEERIDDLLAAVAAGHEGDGLPARIEALLRRDDDAVRAVLAFIRGEKATKMIADALAASGTPASQDALCALARDVHLPAHVRAEAVSSLGLIKRPTAPTMTAVADLIRVGDPKRAAAELVAPAMFLAGSVARAGRADHPAQAAAIEKIVLAEAARARGTDEVLDALAALGNLGSTAVLPRLRAPSLPATRGSARPPYERCGWCPTPKRISYWPRRSDAITTRLCAPRRYSPRDSGSSTRWSTRSRTARSAIPPITSAPARSRCWREIASSRRGSTARSPTSPATIRSPTFAASRPATRAERRAPKKKTGPRLPRKQAQANF
jgi:hypothetical protein